MAPTPKRIGRAIRSMSSKAIPRTNRVTDQGARRGVSTPQPGEKALAILRVQIQGCEDLIAKDKNGKSDPFIVVSVGPQRYQTPVVKRTLAPTWSEKDATFDFPIHLSVVAHMGAIELVVWDKDMLTKEYMGEASIAVEQWFMHSRPAYDDPANTPFTVDLLSTRSKSAVSGHVKVKVGLVPHPDNPELNVETTYAEILKHTKAAEPSILSAPPTEGIGTIRAGEGPQFEDDGLSSDEEGEQNEEEETYFDALSTVPPIIPTGPTPVASSTPTPKGPEPGARKPTPGLQPIDVSGQGPTASSQKLTSESPTESGTSTPSGKQKRPKFKRSKQSDYALSGGNDIVGIVMIEIDRAEDLPRLKNMFKTGFDMDPFVVISFGKKVFRTRVIRHSLNPVWNEKLLFHVRRYESAFKLNFTILDWDKLSGNDLICDASFGINELVANVPQANPNTGLYPEEAIAQTMREYKLPLTTEKDSGWEAKHAPVLTVRAQYQPYAAIRQKFWRQYIKQYDTDDTNTISQLELTSMLDSLGSTLSHDTVDNFFTRFGKSPAEGELTADEVIQCLETEVTRPPSEKRKISIDQTIGHTNVPTPTTPGNQISHSPQGGNLPLSLDKLDFTGQAALPPSQDTEKIVQAAVESIPTANNNLEPSQKPLSNQLQPNAGVESSRPVPPVRRSTGNITPGSTSSSDAYDSTNDSGETVERVINIKTCPLCHRPRMNAKAEMDIVTHLAVCASQDWARVDRLVVGNFVTASQAQRKWYTKVMTIVSSGTYQLGANSANIIVQNRMTGKLEEEKMQGYVRVGIRLLYKGVKGRMEGSRARNLLKSMSIKQGVKYNSPESAREIPSFIAFHNLDVNEIRDPLPSFKSFNEFFYRKLKEDARPVDSPNDPTVLVSGADCRLMAFESVNEATRIWIKGREFSVQRLLGPAYADDAAKFTGGALCIFRLAPQDYHRFHSPVDGRIGPMTYIAGEYYTVNPQAIRTSLDVYGENARKIVPIDSPTFGRVMAVCVGAMMVGSIVTTVQEGEEVKRGQEFGYFAFGGSTIVLLVQPGAVQWDEDLLINGRASLETLVRVGMRLGKKPTA